MPALLRAFSAALLMLGLLSARVALAQAIPPVDLQTLEGEIQKQNSAQAQADEARRVKQRQDAQTQEAQTQGADPFAPALGGPCFEIDDIELTGFEPFAQEPRGYRGLIGTCATAADIAFMLNTINEHYQELGYVTTRAYVPEQDVADGSLDITIVPGLIEGYVYQDGTQADGRIKAAFPTDRGDLLNLRDLEQGLDNMNGPKSAKAQFRLIPGAQAGGSFVEVQVEDQRPWHFDLSFNNTGFDTTGVVKGSVSLGLDNVLGLNDQLSFGATTTPFDNRSDKYSDAYSLSWGVPVGNWSYGIDIGKSGYFFILPGINQSYPVKGNSHYGTLSVERLVARDAAAKAYFYGNLKLTRTQTFIDGFEIESQRRRLTIGSLGLRGETSFEQGAKLTWDVGVKFGLDKFDAYVLDKSIVDPEFRLLKTRLSYEHPIGDAGALYKGTLVAQYSNDILPGTEQISIGSWSSVRGFHDDSMYGDSGAYLNNTIEWDAHKGADIELRMKAGLDIGYIEPSQLRNWSQDYLVGVSLGADVKIQKKATLTLQVAHALSRPEENPPNAQPAFEADRTVASASFKMEF